MREATARRRIVSGTGGMARDARPTLAMAMAYSSPEARMRAIFSQELRSRALALLVMDVLKTISLVMLHLAVTAFRARLPRIS